MYSKLGERLLFNLNQADAREQDAIIIFAIAELMLQPETDAVEWKYENVETHFFSSFIRSRHGSLRQSGSEALTTSTGAAR